MCLCTLAPGATNLVIAAAYAQLGAMPMLMLTGQKPIKTSKQGAFQILDVVDMMRPLTKYTLKIVSADRIPARVRGAFVDGDPIGHIAAPLVTAVTLFALLPTTEV